jgi:hypothetical protein
MTAVAPLRAVTAVLPDSLLTSTPVRILAAFVAINTVMYGALALAKVLPRLHPTRWIRRDNRRSEDRSIYPRG